MEEKPKVYQLKQFRRHKRANVNSQRDRNYYLDGKFVAKNKNNRTGQDKPSIKDFYEKQISKMVVTTAKRLYNRISEFPRGSVVRTNKSVNVVQGTSDYGKAIKFVGEKLQRTKLVKPELLLMPSGLTVISG